LVAARLPFSRIVRLGSSTPPHFSMRLKFISLFLIILFFLFLNIPARGARADALPTSTPTREPGMAFPGLLTPPATVSAPSQADLGAQTYFYICLACHGQSGEGLDAWRKKLNPPDNNCFQSKCHAPNHMDFGFTFPHEVPALHNPAMLLTFQNAYNLFVFIKTRMPWQNPNSLSDAKALELTAFLMRMNGRDLGAQALTVAGARNISFLPSTATPVPSLSAPADPFLLGVAALLLAAGLLAVFAFFRRRS
jgi:hypothetical protein